MRQFVCPSCQAVNRMSDERDAAKAKCGRCHEPLFTGHPAEVGGEALDAHVRSTQGAAILLDVWAPWCGPCRAMAPQFERAAQRLEPQVRLLKLNSDNNQAAAAKLGVQGIPALFLFKDGKVVARTAGAMGAEQLIAWVRQALPQVAA
ncbi:MAG TPA: thioredoxin TrxC [Caulobacteraceae bacterium]|nr:thioredoxin TrxC [Caulobacteraceae bacterium]